ncbi:hypothetical protein [Streptomyces sp. NBC_00059]|uniref:hypothetical protein n=1 Tax=Streptomyces sp. NBC_00059 TaxID=2975635 RepID=UPI0022571A4E|nr:hypothetical protein [Streptomyces sp. NBC_00059]MCX5414513.1 hypothetical protein [Streptomyces sp. NBC_00059]
MNVTRTDLTLLVIGTVLALLVACLVGIATAVLSLFAGESLPAAAMKGGRACTATLMLLIAVAALAANAFTP